jgi:hypothetical protein
MGRIYSARNEERTNLLQEALNEIATVVAPRTADDWNVVGTDSERVLRVWVAREDNEVAREMARQLVDLMYELAGSDPAPAPAPERVEHVTEDERPTLIIKEEEDEEKKEIDIEMSVPDQDSVSHEDSEVEAEADAEESEEESEEEEEEEEVIEPEEAEEEEEEAMEVEQIHIRGRAYWLETNSKKIYAVVDEDDVGDEVGIMVNGKPQFLAKGA